MDRGELGTGAHGETVAALGVEVALHRAPGLLVFGNLVEHGADVAHVVIGDDEEGGRGVGGNRAGGNTKRAGVNGDLEIAAAIHAVDRVGGLRVAGGGAVDEHGDGFTVGGEPHGADAFRFEVPLCGAAADEPHGALDILARM